jgi:hypothetical protein
VANRTDCGSSQPPIPFGDIVGHGEYLIALPGPDQSEWRSVSGGINAHSAGRNAYTSLASHRAHRYEGIADTIVQLLRLRASGVIASSHSIESGAPSKSSSERNPKWLNLNK